MEKSKQSYILKDVKESIKQGKIITPNIKVIASANEIGFSETEAYDEILKLVHNSFYKSMTENYNHKVWQDVYKAKIRNLPIYIKFQIIDGKFLLRSFKPNEQA